MPKFDTSVQELKYKVLKEVARLSREDRLQENLLSIPETIIPGPEPTTRCCIYKERAIVGQRIQMALGGHPEKTSEVEVLTIACDECPVSRMTVGDACRGCIARRCEHVCPKDAISHPNHTAVIDPKKCIACGKCASACPYGAITKNVRPCERACKPGAIHMDENHKAEIDEEKCVSCGACVYQCPFGAIVDKSYILSVVRLLKEAAREGAGPLYAVIAPSIAGQFGGVKTGQILKTAKDFTVETGRTYRLKVEVSGTRVRCWADEELLVDYETGSPAEAEAYQVVSRAENGDLIVKLVNVTEERRTFAVRIENETVRTADVYQLAGGSNADENRLDEPETCSVREFTLGDLSDAFNLTVPALSVTVLRFPA